MSEYRDESGIGDQRVGADLDEADLDEADVAPSDAERGDAEQGDRGPDDGDVAGPRAATDLTGAEQSATPGPDPTDEPVSGPAAPETGDLVIDAALRDLAEAPPDDLDAQVERGEQVQRTLQGRLSDLGG